MWLELIKAMHDKGITSKDLANKMGLHIMTISQYRTGKRNPNLETIRAIATALEISPKELV